MAFANFDRCGSASGRKVTSCRSPRARYAASAPLTRITVAPTDRVGARPASTVTAEGAEAGEMDWLCVFCALGGCFFVGHLSVAPYGFAGSVAASTAISA